MALAFTTFYGAAFQVLWTPDIAFRSHRIPPFLTNQLRAAEMPRIPHRGILTGDNLKLRKSRFGCAYGSIFTERNGVRGISRTSCFAIAALLCNWLPR